MALPAAYAPNGAATSSGPQARAPYPAATGEPFGPASLAASLSLDALQSHDPGAKAGGIERRFLCPFPACAGHQNPKTHRCLTLNTQTGAWNCKRCHEKGLLTEWHTHRADAAARPFVSKRDRDRDRLRSLLATAPRPVASKAEPDADTKRDLAGLLAGVKPLENTKGAAYLDGRGLPADFCHAAGVRFHRGFLGRPAVVFSLRDAARSCGHEQGRIVALHGRYTDGRTDPKSRTRGPMQQAVFATPGAWSGDPWQGRVVITEAPLDALTLAFCGVPAVALCGTSGGKELLRERLALRQAVAAFDSDAAGHDAGRALAAWLAPVGCQVLRLLPPTGAKDWNEALQSIGPDALREHLAAELSDGAIMPRGINADGSGPAAPAASRPIIPQGIATGTNGSKWERFSSPAAAAPPPGLLASSDRVQMNVAGILPCGHGMDADRPDRAADQATNGAETLVFDGSQGAKQAENPAILCHFVSSKGDFSCPDAVFSLKNAENPLEIAPNRQETSKKQARSATSTLDLGMNQAGNRYVFEAALEAMPPAELAALLEEGFRERFHTRMEESALRKADAENKRERESIRDAMRALLAAAASNTLPVVAVPLGPGRAATNPNRTAGALLSALRVAVENMTPTEARPHPWPGWEAAAQNALDDLETLALWWRGLPASASRANGAA